MQSGVSGYLHHSTSWYSREGTRDCGSSHLLSCNIKERQQEIVDILQSVLNDKSAGNQLADYGDTWYVTVDARSKEVASTVKDELSTAGRRFDESTAASTIYKNEQTTQGKRKTDAVTATRNESPTAATKSLFTGVETATATGATSSRKSTVELASLEATSTETSNIAVSLPARIPMRADAIPRISKGKYHLLQFLK